MQAGFHNDHLQDSTARIIDGGSWKNQRVVWLIPAGQKIDSVVYIHHRAVITPPNQPFVPYLAKGMEVGEAYSNAITEILAGPLKDWEYILCIEHDNVPPQDGLLRLIRSMELHPELHAIGGLYWTKGEGGVPQIWGDNTDPLQNYRPQPPIKNTSCNHKDCNLRECCGTGQGFTLFRMSMFRDPNLRKPWFKTVAAKGEGVGTQDLYFWSDARAHGYRCAIDLNVRVGHRDTENDFTW